MVEVCRCAIFHMTSCHGTRQQILHCAWIHVEGKTFILKRLSPFHALKYLLLVGIPSLPFFLSLTLILSSWEYPFFTFFTRCFPLTYGISVLFLMIASTLNKFLWHRLPESTLTIHNSQWERNELIFLHETWMRFSADKYSIFLYLRLGMANCFNLFNIINTYSI